MSIWDYIHRYAPEKDKNDPVKYTNDMVNRFNKIIGKNIITKDTSLGELKEALIQAGLDPEHTITRAHLQTEDPSVLADLGKTTQAKPETKVQSRPQVMAPKKQPVINPNPTFEVLPGTRVQTEPQIFKKPTVNPNPTFTASPYATPQTVQTQPKVEEPVDSRFKVLPDVLPKIERQPEKVVTETKDPSFLEKAWMYVFESDVPIEETKKVKEAADGNPTEDEEFVRDTNEPLLPKRLAPLTSIRKVAEDPKIKQRKIEDDNFTRTIGYSKVNDKVYRGKSHKNLNLGSYSKMIIDMSDGITVTYQPRNSKKDNRTEVNNAIAITDYLYDFDFTDNVYDKQADYQITKLKESLFKPADWEKRTYINAEGKTVKYAPWSKNWNNALDGRKFVTIREPLGNNKYKVSIKPIDSLTEKDFENTIIYRQGYAKLSDLDITPDQKKIKLFAKSDSFVGQGLPFRDENNKEHGLRVSGGKGNVSVNLKGENVKGYLNIASLNQFGAYLGGTVTIISEDGKVAKKVSGSLKDVLETAFHIKKQTGSKEIYFLQSDAGSMNIKADANNGKITPAQLAIARNQEPQAGAAEILLNE